MSITKDGLEVSNLPLWRRPLSQKEKERTPLSFLDIVP